MYREGHAGLSLILFSPFMFLFRLMNIEMNYVLLTCFLMVALSSLPDFDIQWEIKHRGITHTFLFGIGTGTLFGFLIMYMYGFPGLLMGFIAGFGGTASHLLGDSFTYSPFKPLYPFSDRKVAYGLFKASNQTANSTMLVLGFVLFIISYEPTIFTTLIGSLV